MGVSNPPDPFSVLCPWRMRICHKSSRPSGATISDDDDKKTDINPASGFNT
jgi:hypothetical protein